MKYNHKDINDDEIRIISSSSGRADRKRHKVALWTSLSLLAVLLVGVLLLIIFLHSDSADEHETVFEEEPPRTVLEVHESKDSVIAAEPFVDRCDTVVNGVELFVLTPHNAVPTLEIGRETLEDSSIILVAQAADIRRDNGEIVGSYVVKGQLVGKGEAKAGFCSIINGAITVGVADATPMLEQALMSDGYFFRQYPLVVGGQVVENKPKGKSVRRALVDINGEKSVVISRKRLTFHDFAQALVDLGARNAIYLVGGGAYCRYTDSSGNMFTFGSKWDKRIDNVNFIVWR